MNSGIIDIDAERKVYRVNKIVCPASYVSNSKNVLIANDLPEPRPPVTIK
jgi:hypothetical protein